MSLNDVVNSANHKDISENGKLRVIESCDDGDDFAEVLQYPEKPSEYGFQGYMPVDISQQINQYIILRKSGVGNFSTVWIAYDTEKKNFAALKITKANPNYVKLAKEEYKILNNIKNQSKTLQGYNRLIHAENFLCVEKNEQIHAITVFGSIGISLLSLLLTSGKGLDYKTLQKISLQVLEGLFFLHDHCQMIHSDLKPDNILVTLPRRRKYNIIRKVIEADFKGSGMIMNAPKKYFTTLNPEDLRSIFDSILSNYDENADLEIGDVCKAKKQKTIDYSLFEKSNKIDTSKNEEIEPGTALKINSNNILTNEQNDKFTEINNFLLDTEVNIKIIDFGGTVNTNKKAKRIISTLEYRAPELILDFDITPAIDIWSFACTFFELATMKYLFYDDQFCEDSDADLLAEIYRTMQFESKVDVLSMKNAKYFFKYFDSDGYPKDILKIEQYPSFSLLQKMKYNIDEKIKKEKMLSFIRPMLNFDPKSRPTAQECLQHSFITNYHE